MNENIADVQDLVQPHPEEGAGGWAAAQEWNERADYALELDFASLQLRARRQAPKAWDNYTRMDAPLQVLRDLLEREGIEQNPAARREVLQAIEQQSAQRSHHFALWMDVNALAWAEGYKAIDAEATRTGVEALHWMEQAEADELLTAQAASARWKADREAAEAAEKAEAQAVTA